MRKSTIKLLLATLVAMVLSLLLPQYLGLGKVTAQTTSFAQCSGAPLIWPSYGERGFIWKTAEDPAKFPPTADGDYLHDGIDIVQVNQQENVEPVYAAYDGYLSAVSAWALRLEINIASNYDVPQHHVFLYYTHMANNSGTNSYILQKYQGANHVWVNKGELLGHQGRKGVSGELVHLHVSVSTSNTEKDNIDPTKYFGDINLDATTTSTPSDWTAPALRCKNGNVEYIVGSLGGTVSNAAGSPLQYASYLNLITAGNTYTTWSGANGSYLFENVPAGVATIKAVDISGNSVVVNNVTVVGGLSKLLNIKLNNSCVDGATLQSIGTVSGASNIKAAANDCSPIQYPASGSPCGQKSNGLYCGSTLGLNSGTLYRCSNGIDSLAQVCSYGCTTQPAGTDDYCSPPPSSGSYCPNNQDGWYCGSSVGLDPNTLYYCQNGVKTVSQVCSLGCIQKPPGTADVCRTSTSGGSCPNGNGDYCGSTLGLDPNTLFSCSNGNINIKEQCSNGCQLNPPGVADACYPPGSNNGGGTGSKVVLYGDSNYGANTIRVQAGIGDTDEPNRGAAYKSMSIPSGWSVILSDQHLGLVGNSKCYSQSQPNLETEGWAFSIESMRVFGTNVCPPDPFDGIKICRETGQKNCMVVSQDIPSLGQAGFGNDTLKSVELGGSWELVLFEDDNYGGRRYITGSINDMGGTPFGYGASSIQVRKRDPAAFTLYHLGDFNGGEQFYSDRTVPDLSFWDGSTTPSDQRWNDNAQSIRVASGYEVVLCTDGGFHGVCGRTNHDNGDLNSVFGGLRNNLSSIQVCQGSCAPTSVVPNVISPGNAETYAPGTPITLSWNGNGSEYLVEYWGGNFGNTIQSIGWRKDTLAWTLNNLPVSSTPYQWRVKSWTTVGESGWSPTYTFSIQDPAPVQVYINGPTNSILNADQAFTALTSPSDAVNLQYVWSPTPKSGQGTASAVYNWNTVGNQTISVSVQNTGGSANTSLVTNVGCGEGKYLAEYYNNNDLSGSPISYACESEIDVNWGAGGPSQISSNILNLGNGQDGNLTVNPGQTAYTDNVRTQLSNSVSSGANTICVASTAGLAVGDEILVIQSMGTGAGNYEFDQITGINSCWLTLQSNLANSYSTPNSAAQVLRVPHYQNVTVFGTLTAHQWNGVTGGVMAFRASGVVNLNGGKIDGSALGYRGGARTYGAAVTGKQGEGTNGAGGASRNPNEPGGGGGGPGTNDGGAGAGGGAFRTPGATAKDPFYGDPGIGSSVIYGDSNLSKLYFGGAGGAGGTDDSGWDNNSFGGRGGNGGGVVYIEANSITGSGSIISNGEKGEDHNGVADSEHGGGGGGAGGSLKILADKINTDGIQVNTSGAAGGKAKDGDGGSGGSGQTFIQYCDKSGSQALPGNSVQLSNCTKDKFSVRWTGYINFPNSSNYTFTTSADDGIRVFLEEDPTPLINKWNDGYGSNQATKFVNTGVRKVKVEYYENTGDAQAHVGISEVVTPAPVLSQIPSKTINQGGNFANINLNNYVTNLAQQTGISWTASGNHNLQVSINNNIATVTAPQSWSGSESITFTVHNANNQTANSTAQFTVNGPVVCAADLFKAEYFNNTDLTGTAAMSRCESEVNHNWAYESPDPIVNIDNFSARWSTTLHVSDANAQYTFSVTGDDGVRLYVDNVLQLDKWVLQGETTYEVPLDLSVGNHNIRMEYFESGGAAVARLKWQLNHVPTITAIPNQTIDQGGTFTNVNLSNHASDADGDPLVWVFAGNNAISINITNNIASFSYPTDWTGSETITFSVKDSHDAYASTEAVFTVTPVFSCPPEEYRADYFTNVDLTGTPLVTRCEAALNHNWGSAAPVAGVPANNFSTRWTRTTNVPVGGTYLFVARSDEGMRVYVDGQILIDHWVAHTLKVDRVATYLATGNHKIIVEYYEQKGVALARLDISLVNKPPVIQVIPNQRVFQGQSFQPIDLSNYGSDPDAGDYVTWSYSGNTNLTVAINNNIATVTYPNIWVGTEYVTFTATDKYGASVSRKVRFRVDIIASCPLGQYKAQYYNNTTLSGVPAFTRCETEIPDYDWGTGSPLPGINTDNFSVRWTGKVKFTPAGYYKFTTSSDDGIRLYVDGARLINNWTDHSLAIDMKSRKLTAGYHTLKMEYYENGGGAIAALDIEGPGVKPTINPIPIQSKLSGSNFPTVDLNSYISDPDANESFTWSIVSSPKMLSPRLDGNLLTINNATNWTGTDSLTLKVVDSYGLSSQAVITFQSHLLGSCIPLTGGYCVDYYANKDLKGAVVFSNTESTINHNWGIGSPNANVPVDNFSARWQGNISFRAGVHSFRTISDDGVRLYVDGQLVIDNWTDHASTVNDATLNLTAGFHSIQMDYYEAGGGAIAKLQIR